MRAITLLNNKSIKNDVSGQVITDDFSQIEGGCIWEFELECCERATRVLDMISYYFRMKVLKYIANITAKT